MAELAVEMATTTIRALLKKLVVVVSSELNMPGRLRQDVRFIENELRRMKDFLRSADARAETDARLRESVKKVNDLAYDTEDIIDEFKVHMNRQRRRHGTMGFLYNIAQPIKKWRELHEIYRQLQHMKSRIKQAEESSPVGFHVPTSSASTGEEPHAPGLIAALFVEERDLVGIDKPRDDLIRLLLNGSKSLRVISVVAMGGMGKTALVKNVYDGSQVRNGGHFDCHAWITLSKTFNVKMLLRNMIKQLSARVEEDPTTAVEIHRGPASLLEPYISAMERREMEKRREIETADEVRLIQILRHLLKKKRYVIVFDELWSIPAWESIKLAFPDDELGSRVVITTRNTDIAAAASSLYCAQHHDALVYNLRPLTRPDSWTLFCKRAFGSKDSCPLELKGWSEKIVKKCGGLPLAIVTIGGLLGSKPKTVEQWRRLHDRLGSELETNATLAALKEVLSLSYEDLSYYLKLCFLYLSIFAEDYPIRRGRLVRLWMGEGFIDARHPITVEDTADEYFDQLVKRSMIQVTETDPSGRAKSCKVHDIMREIIITKSREEDFFYAILEPSSPRPTSEVRRLTIQCDVHNPLNINFAHLRSVILFSVFVSSSLKSAKLLRVLDVERQDIGSHFMPHGSRLQHLRYLNLRGTKSAGLPEALSMLQNLEMLDLRDSYIDVLPPGIVELRRLRYLAVYPAERISTAAMMAPRRHGVSMPKGIGGLEELHTLVLANAEPGFIEELEGMKQLRRLGVARLNMENESRFWAAIQNLSCLHSLTADSREDNMMSCMGSLNRLPSLLRSLKLYGLVMEKLPGCIESLVHLAKMVLSGTKLRDDPFPVLEKLPSLSELRLHKDAYVGRELHSGGGFSRLRTLHLMHLSELEVVTVKQEAMPIVESLRIKGCGKEWPTAGRVHFRMEGFRENLIDVDVL